MAVAAELTFNKDGDPLLVAPGDTVGFQVTVTNDTGSAVTITAVEPYIATGAAIPTSQYPITISPVPLRAQVQSEYGNYTETLSTVATGRYFKYAKAAGTAVLTQNGSPLFRTDATPVTAWASDATAVEYNGQLSPPAEGTLDVVAATSGSSTFPFSIVIGATPAKQGGTFTFYVGCHIRFSSGSTLTAGPYTVVVTTPTRYLEGGLTADGSTHVTPVAQTPLPS